MLARILARITGQDLRSSLAQVLHQQCRITASQSRIGVMQLRIIHQLKDLEITMADLGPALDRLEADTTTILGLVQTDVPALQAALEQERTANAALAQQALDTAAAEDAEDVQQNADLADAVATRDAAVSSTDEALTRISSVSDRLESAANPVTPTPEPTPVDGSF